MPLTSPAALAQNLGVDVEGQTLDEVRVKGNRRSEADAILERISTRPGEPLKRKSVQADIRTIFKLGFYSDIQVELEELDGKSVLTFVVEEKPSVRKVIYDGNEELDDEELGEVVDIRPFSILNQAKVNQNAEKLKDLYTEKGYFLAEVDWEIRPLENNEVDVIFHLIEKKEVKVARLAIVGNDALADSDIKQFLETREEGGFGGISGAGSFKAEAFERDLLRVSQLYYDRGYITARVGEPKVELTPDRAKLFITIPVEEGDRYKTGEIDVIGDFLEKFPKEEVMKRVKLKTGDWFSSTQLRNTINGVGEIYKDEGYAYVNIVPNTRVDPETRKVNLTINIEKGEKVRFGRITVVGNTRTRDKVIRREMRIYEGEFYSSTGIKRSKALITRLGYFETVEITTRPNRDGNTMDVVVDVKEKPTGTFQVGAGFSSIESFVAQAQIAQDNLFGRGQNLSFQATLSRLRSIVNLRFADNYFLDTRIRFATNLYRFETNFQNFTRRSLGGNLTLGYPLNDDWSVAGTYTLEYVEVDAGGFGRRNIPAIANLFANGRTSSVRLSLFYDTRNNRLFPSSGWFNTASVEHATGLLFSENLFTRYRLRGRYYYDLGYNMVLKANTEWGTITSPQSRGVPIFERFFLGGPLSMRGFQINSLGPTIPVLDTVRPDSGTVQQNIGGTEQLLINTELEFPILQKVQIRGVAFIDAGNAFNIEDSYADKLDQFRFNWGFGIRWFSPIGPLRFEWGFPFNPRDGEDGSVFNFSIGNFF
ncbi:MAG: outer membrane protein assembly factor BamA [Bradymonadia bacterium]